MLRLAFLLLCLLPATALASVTYLETLQARAVGLGLARTHYWHVLLHYEPNLIGSGFTSAAVSPWFFNAPDGRTDPEAELRATLAAFFSEHKIKVRGEYPQCVFIARYRWLKQKLHFDPERLPKRPCTAYHDWLKALDPGAVAVVFPTAYVNSPASMFGHTLLRIDARNQTRGTRLLAYAVNFAANTKERNGLVFAWKGITGGYAGNFGMYPYYEKVKQYTRIENRDIWSYQLNLSAVEIDRLLAHLWELRGVDFRYYFFSGNCSYQLLALLDAARPGFHLTDAFPAWTIPADTLRVIARQPGLVTRVDYRPSRRTVLKSESTQITRAQRDLALKLADGRLDPGRLAALEPDPAARAQTLDVAHDLVAYRFVSGKIKREPAVARARKLLIARSRIDVVQRVFEPPPRPETPPDKGHATARLAVGPVLEDGDASLGLRIRPAYHDLLDGQRGYPPGAAINFLDLGLRYSFDRGMARIEYLKALEIVSIAPRTAFSKPISWRAEVGLRRSPDTPLFADDQGRLGPYAEGGPGVAYGDPRKLVGYAFALGSSDVNSGLEDGFRVGVGLRLGVLAHPITNWSVRAELGARRFELGEKDRERWISLAQQWQFARNQGIRLELRRSDGEREAWNRVGLSYHYYF